MARAFHSGRPQRGRNFGAQLLEAHERLVGVADVEELVALDAIAAGEIDADERDLERPPVAWGAEQPPHRYATIRVPGEDAERFLARVRCKIRQHAPRRDPFIAAEHT